MKENNGLVYQTFVYEGQRSEFLRRELIEELQAGDTLLDYDFSEPISEEEILPLHMALNRHGPATLLWVAPAERDRPPGMVAVLMAGLFKGSIHRFAPNENAQDLSFDGWFSDGWLRICAHACVLDRLQRSAAAAFQVEAC